MDENAPIVLWQWWITDERTGKRRKTSWHMTEADALERYPDAERHEPSREERVGHGHAADIVTKRFNRPRP